MPEPSPLHLDGRLELTSSGRPLEVVAREQRVIVSVPHLPSGLERRLWKENRGKIARLAQILGCEIIIAWRHRRLWQFHPAEGRWRLTFAAFLFGRSVSME